MRIETYKCDADNAEITTGWTIKTYDKDKQEILVCHACDVHAGDMVTRLMSKNVSWVSVDKTLVP